MLLTASGRRGVQDPVPTEKSIRVESDIQMNALSAAAHRRAR